MKKLLAVLLLAAGAVTVPATAAFADAPSRVSIEDTAGVLDDKAVEDQIRAKDFHQPTHLAIYTQTSGNEAAFDREVLSYAQRNKPEWVSPEGRWADGLVLIAFDTKSKTVQVHTGPDRAMNRANLDHIKDSTLGHRMLGRWDDAAVRGAEYAAAYTAKPWYLSDAFIIPVGAVALTGTGFAVFSMFASRRARRSIAASDSRLALIDSGMDKTAGHAAGIPASSGFGARILAEYRDFVRRRDVAAGLGAKVRGYTFLQLCREKSRLAVKEYDVLTKDLDGVGATVADADALLNMKPGWEDAWFRELQYVKDDLAGVEAAIAGLDFKGTGKALLGWKARVEPLMSDWIRRMTRPRPQVDAVLDEMWKARVELSGLLTAHAETVIQAVSTSPGEQQIVRDSMSGTASIQPRGFGIVERTYLGGDLVTAEEFAQRVRNGRSMLQTHRKLNAQHRRRGRRR